MNTAYDYDRQCWVEGDAATKLRLEQAEADLEILESARGPEYAHFVGSNYHDTLRRCRTEVNRLQAKVR